LHNKPHGCSASVASAAGPFTIKKNVSSADERHWIPSYEGIALLNVNQCLSSLCESKNRRSSDCNSGQ
jgi:hypothetical protein